MRRFGMLKPGRWYLKFGVQGSQGAFGAATPLAVSSTGHTATANQFKAPNTMILISLLGASESDVNLRYGPCAYLNTDQPRIATNSFSRHALPPRHRAFRLAAPRSHCLHLQADRTLKRPRMPMPVLLQITFTPDFRPRPGS